MGAALVGGALLAGCGAPDPTVAVPGFAAAHPDSGPAPAGWGHLLPSDCAALLAPERVPGLLGWAEGSVAVRTMTGVPAPSVGLMERVDCDYTRVDRRGAPALHLRAQAYADAAAAKEHARVNTRAEQAGHRSMDLDIGTAPGTWIEEPGQHVLVVRYNRYVLTVQAPQAAVPGPAAQAIAKDLAQRVLATFPRPVTAPAPGPPDARASAPASGESDAPMALRGGPTPRAVSTPPTRTTTRRRS